MNILVILEARSDNEVTEYPVAQTVTAIGRSDDNQVILKDSMVSRHHAQLEWDMGALCVTDLGSSNGTMVNGVKIHPGLPFTLKAGDRFTVGSYTLTVRLTSPIERTQPSISGERDVVHTSPEAAVAAKRGMLTRKKLLAGIAVVLLLLVGATIGTILYCYNQLETDFQVQEYSLEIEKPDLGSIIHTILETVKGDPLAATEIIKGLNVEGTVVISNPSFITLHIPAIKHKAFTEGKDSPDIIQTEAMSIAPHSHESQRLSLFIDLDELPELALNTLASGGTVKTRVVSEIPVGIFTITKTSIVETSVTNPLSSYMK